MSRRLLQSFFARFAIRSAAIPSMHQFVMVTGETVSLFVPIGWYVVRISSIKGTNEIIRTGPVGEAWELDRNAAGRAVLAFKPEPERKRFLAAFEQQTSRTEREALESELGVTRVKGYSTITDAGKSEFSIPIPGAGDLPLGALAIEGNVA